MLRIVPLLLSSLLLISNCFGQSVFLEGPKTAEVKQVILIDTTGTVGTFQKWILPDNTQSLPGTNGIALVFPTPGIKEIHLVSSTDKGIAVGSWTINVGGIPEPPPIDPPTPPQPPVPPTPSIAPIPYPGFRVLMVYDSAVGVPSTFVAKTINDYLNTHCVKGADNKTPDYKRWDVGLDTSTTSKMWQDAYKRPRTVVPWIIISDGVTGYEGPAPATIPDMMNLLKKYGGE